MSLLPGCYRTVLLIVNVWAGNLEGREGYAGPENLSIEGLSLLKSSSVARPTETL